jgi:hypothetical protein
LYKSALGGFPTLPTVCSSFAGCATIAVATLTMEAHGGEQAKRFSSQINPVWQRYFLVCAAGCGGSLLGFFRHCQRKNFISLCVRVRFF